MADHQKIKALHPALADFRLSELIGFRGDVMAYRANVKNDSFSTDAQGFRHSTFAGKTMSVVGCTQEERYGIVLGASNIFAVGVAGNENTMPSQLAERFGFPFANAAMPGGNSRNLYSLLVTLVAAARQPPAVVVLSNGGDLANFCEAGITDQVFGSPNRMQLKSIEIDRTTLDVDGAFERLLAFSTHWASVVGALCRLYGVPLAMTHQSTFFEKTKPTPAELECKLGQTDRAGQKIVFGRFKLFNPRFFAKRREIAEQLSVPLGGWGLTDKLTFIDEFHVDRDSIRLLSQKLGDAVEPLLPSSKPKAGKAKA